MIHTMLEQGHLQPGALHSRMLQRLIRDAQFHAAMIDLLLYRQYVHQHLQRLPHILIPQRTDADPPLLDAPAKAIVEKEKSMLAG